jgi:hypothetical protein
MFWVPLNLKSFFPVFGSRFSIPIAAQSGLGRKVNSPIIDGGIAAGLVR